MRKVLLILFIFTLNNVLYFQDLFYESLSISDVVVHAKIESKQSYFGDDGEIYTNNRLRVLKVLKSTNENRVNFMNVVTKGGIIGDIFSYTSHTHQIPVNFDGIFCAKSKYINDNVLYSVKGLKQPMLIVDQNSPKSDKIYGEIHQWLLISDEPFYSEFNGQYEYINPATENLLTSVSLFLEFRNVNVSMDSVDFDIYAKSNAQDVKFSGGDIYMTYDTVAFGTYLDQNNNIETERREVIIDTIYGIEAIDVFSDKVNISIFSDFDTSSFYELSTDFRPLLNCKVSINNIVALASISFDTDLIQGSCFYYDENTNTTVPFENVKTSNDILPFLNPSITSFSPVDVRSGNNEYITIIGNNFGLQDSNSNVYFTNANFVPTSGLPVYSPAFQVDISNWTNNSITVLVPSVAIGGGTAGTGKIIVENGSGRDTSSTNLNVIYSINNIKLPDDITGDTLAGETRVSLAKLSGAADSFGFVWFLDNNIISFDPLVDDIVDDAVDNWRCNTDVSWRLDPTTSNNGSVNIDAVNTIVAEPDSTFDNPVFLAETRYLGRLEACTGTDLIYYFDVDIAIRNDPSRFDFALGNDPIALNKRDFYSVILHELGHALTLGHVFPANKVMFPILPTGLVNRTLGMPAIDAVENVLINSIDSLTSPGSCLSPIGRKICEPNNIYQFGKDENITIYPTVVRDFIQVDFDDALLGYINYEIIDLNGAILKRSFGSFRLSESFSVDVSEIHQRGMYFIRLFNDLNEIATFKFIKL
ncbi:hypothetical protein CEQ90_20215 [Lewinellaceae bacterium SD302]|nr:hypothetical protein CEQ90_20215 [Lewinellaceae bacterium SD302]